MEIVKPLEDQNIVEKEPIKFTCELSKSGVKVSWLKDGFKVSEEDGFKITVDGTKHTITKDSATLEDAGKYMLVFEDKKTAANLGVEREFGFYHSFCLRYVRIIVSDYSYILMLV